MKMFSTAPEWNVFQEDDSTGEIVDLQIRAVPALLLREMENRHLGRKRTFKQQKGVQIVEVDTDTGSDLADEKAAYSLVNSRGRYRVQSDPPKQAAGFEVPVETDADAAFYAKELGAEAVVGQAVTLDGHWTPAVKTYVFARYPNLVIWVNSTADGKAKKGKQEEDDLGKT